jgi:hypothetical protein
MASNIPVAPTKKKKKSSGGGSSSGGSSGGSSGTRKKSSGGGTKKSSDPYLAAQQAAQAKADKKEREAKRKSSDRYIKQADTLQKQADALRVALGGSGFRRALSTKLGNIGRVQKQADAVLLKGFNERLSDLRGSAVDNEKAAAQQSLAGLSNRGRERAQTISEAMLQGAGETDLLRAQNMALGNWEANQAETNRNYFDTVRSINASIGDLNTDTRTARVNNAVQANADREGLWTTYYNQVSDAYTQLGNIKGQQAEYLGLANEQVSSKKVRKDQRRIAGRSGNFYEQASRTQGKAYKNPGVSASLRNWAGGADERPEEFAQRPVGAPLFAAGKSPEGATLRKW